LNFDISGLKNIKNASEKGINRASLSLGFCFFLSTDYTDFHRLSVGKRMEWGDGEMLEWGTACIENPGVLRGFV